MSGSRSIASARQRRAGEQAPAISGRPNKSILSQPAFAQQQQQQQQQQPNKRMYSNSNENQYINNKNNNFSDDTQRTAPPATKISISDAIGLITIRLGRVEQHMQYLQENNTNENQFNISENKGSTIDPSIITNMMERINELEKMDKQKLLAQVNYLENSIKEIKNIISVHHNGYNRFMMDTTKQLKDKEDQINQLEQIISVNNNGHENGMSNEIEIENEEDEQKSMEFSDELNKRQTILTSDLKEIIQQELVNENV